MRSANFSILNRAHKFETVRARSRHLVKKKNHPTAIVNVVARGWRVSPWPPPGSRRRTPVPKGALFHNTAPEPRARRAVHVVHGAVPHVQDARRVEARARLCAQPLQRDVKDFRIGFVRQNLRGAHHGVQRAFVEAARARSAGSRKSQLETTATATPSARSARRTADRAGRDVPRFGVFVVRVQSVQRVLHESVVQRGSPVRFRSPCSASRTNGRQKPLPSPT